MGEGPETVMIVLLQMLRYERRARKRGKINGNSDIN
jgi:hypothetical protein